MSKRSMLKQFEINGRGRSSLVVALPGLLHSKSGCLLPWTNQRPPSTATLVRGAGETDLVDLYPVRKAIQPCSQQHSGRAEALLRLLVDKRVHRHAGAWAPKS